MFVETMNEWVMSVPSCLPEWADTHQNSFGRGQELYSHSLLVCLLVRFILKWKPQCYNLEKLNQETTSLSKEHFAPPLKDGDCKEKP